MKILKLTALALASVAVSLILAEFATRVIGHYQDIDYSLYLKDLTHSDRGPGLAYEVPGPVFYKLKPGAKNIVTTSDFTATYTVNSLGMRDREYPVTKPAGSYRVLAMGDSFTFGEGVRYGYRFTDIAEENLKNTEIMNTGIPGYGVDQSLMLYLEDGVKLNPDHVVLFINQVDTRRFIEDYYQDQRMTVLRPDDDPIRRRGSPVVAPYDPVRLPPPDFYFHSQLLTYLIYLHRARGLRDQFEIQDLGHWGKLANKTPDSDAPKTETDEVLIARTRNVIQNFKQACERNGTRFTVVNIDPLTSLAYLKEIPGLDYVDLTPRLVEAAKTGPLRFKYDRHFNESANLLIGRELTEILKARRE